MKNKKIYLLKQIKYEYIKCFNEKNKKYNVFLKISTLKLLGQ